MSANSGADPALVPTASNPQAVSTKGFDPGELNAALLSVVTGFRRKLATYVSVYPGDKELRRLLSECDDAIEQVGRGL